jgi:ribonuclease BN (tRNA processing enzyme)
MSEDRLANQMVFSGDSMPLSTYGDFPLRGAEVAFLDSTFLSVDDRNGFTHATMDEVAETCRANQVRVAYAMHLSIRYSAAEIRQRMTDLAQTFPLKLVPNHELTYLN